MSDRSVSSIKADAGACNSPAPDLPSLHRLSNREYESTVRDLFGTKQRFASEFPPDVTSNGFDNAAAAHSVSTTIIEKYLDAGKRLAKEHADTVSMTCKDDASCYDGDLLKIGEKAFRRPFFPGESDRLSGFANNLRSSGMSPRDAYEQSLSGILVSPQFLFRLNGGSKQIDNQEQYELASRLSYFFWSTMPDEMILGQIKSGGLNDPESLRKVVATMAKDAKTIGFVRNFSRQWLGHHQLAAREPGGQLDAGALEDLKTESLSFIAEFVRSNRNLKELLSADFSFLNDKLGKLYNNAEASGDFTKVQATNRYKLGLLSQGVFLVSTSGPTLTSPVRRGHWILDNILCEPPPPSPPNVDFGAFKSAGANVSARERLQQHRTNPSCAACHEKIDGIGLAFENYDANGVWRESDAAGKIVADGKLPDGFTFSSVTELADYLKNSPAFPRCVAQKMATYALGRAPQGSELCVIDKIGKRAEGADYGFRDMMVDISLELLAK